MIYSKLQACYLVILLYILFMYLRESRAYRHNLSETFFKKLLVLGILCVIFDGATAYTVNHPDTVNPVLNKALYLLFLVSVDSVVFVLFLYMLYITELYPKKLSVKIAGLIPFAVNIIVVVMNINSLEVVQGKYTNYVTGVSVHTCFIMAFVYTVMAAAVFGGRLKYIERHKRMCIELYILVFFAGMLVQLFVFEPLISSASFTFLILGFYISYEDPALKTLSHYYSEMIMGFATLIENRDGNTGEHIKRTTEYVELIVLRLQAYGYYRNVLTKDYISNLKKAAPIHDIGKISVPDAILRKPGKLTDEEFGIMKKHAEDGGRIIRETLGKFGNREYVQTAYEVARYHHEKWNGRGYPDGLSKEEIPLCARIMAVADVFDAVSEKRCYRDALPLEECFDIIRRGAGQDFDPLIAGVFLEIRPQVEEVHRSFSR